MACLKVLYLYSSILIREYYKRLSKKNKSYRKNVKNASSQLNLLKSYKAITLNPEVLPTFTLKFISYFKVHTIRLNYTINSLMPFIVKII